VAERNAMIRGMAACIQAGVSSFVWGMPGTTKTAKIGALGAAFGRHVEWLVASAHESVDFTGLPIAIDGHVEYAPLKWAVDLAGSRSGLLAIDEFTTAGSAQKGLLRIVNERMVGHTYLGDHVSIVAIANPPEIAVDGMDLAAPTANRFIHFDWVFDLGEWMSGVGSDFDHVEIENPSAYLTDGKAAHRARATQMVTGFLGHRPDLVQQIPADPADQGKAWPSPRSWTNVIRALAYLPADDEDARDLVIHGGVGRAVGTEFIAWLASNDLHDPAAVLRDPTIVNWSALRPDRAFALLNGIQAIVQIDGSYETWNQGMAVAEAAARGGRPDTATPFVRALTRSTHMSRGVTASFRAAFGTLLNDLAAARRAA